MLPKITKVDVLDDYLLKITLSDSYVFNFDFKPYLALSCNKALEDYTLFKQAKCFMRMVYWSDEHDIHLDQMIPERYLQVAS